MNIAIERDGLSAGPEKQDPPYMAMVGF